MKNTSSALHRIEEIGFRNCGLWSASEDGAIKLTLSEYAQNANVLYAFVGAGKVLYIGKTTQQLKKRLYGYQNPRGTQLTNKRGNEAIAKSLSAGERIEIYALPDNGLLRLGGFHLNLAAGLEDSLINDLRPPWNKRFGKEDAKAKAKSKAQHEE
jgi:hypothetical protein